MFERIRTRLDRRRPPRGWAPWMWIGAVAVTGGGGGVAWSVADWRIEQTEDRLVCGIERHLLGIIGAKATPGASQLAVEETEQQACRALFDPANIESCPVFAPSAYERCLNLWRASTRAAPPQPAASAPARVLVTAIQHAPRVTDTGVFSWAAGFVMRSAQPLMAHGIDADCRSAETGTALWLTRSKDHAESQGHACLGVALEANRFATAAHCVDDGSKISVYCESNAAGTGGTSGTVETVLQGAHCTMARETISTDAADSGADLAVCDLGPASGSCYSDDFVKKKVLWDKPPANQQPSSLHITGISNFEARVCKTSGTISWPQSADSASNVEPMRATLPYADNEWFTIDPGDSGGPVYSHSDGTEPTLIGVSVRAAATGGHATIAPFYLWKTKFGPVPP